MGQASSYTPELAAEICERLSKGEPMAVICRDEHMPAVRTVSDWRAADSDFAASIARAREEGFDALGAECLQIADDGSRDYRTNEDSDWPIVDHDHIQRSKLRIETRLKLLAKWDPKRYGDKVAIEHSGNLRTSREMPDAELERIAAGGSAGAASPQASPFIVRDLL